MIKLTSCKLVTGLLLLLAALAVHAQMGLDIDLNRTVYMQYEPVYACISLRNDSGRALVFGSDPRLQGFILFEIRDANGRVVPKRPGAEISVTGLILGPGEVKRMVLPVNKYYNIDALGTYRINVYLSHSMLPSEYKSRDLKFQVAKGVDNWSRTVGIPDLTGKNAGKAIPRTYTIRSLVEGSNRYYYLIVEDAQKVFGVMRIGRAIGQEKFQAEIDMLSRIHLLMPVSPKVGHYLAFSIDGENIANEYRKTTSTIPSLLRDPVSGTVSLVGGEPARIGIDFKDPSYGKTRASKLIEDNADDDAGGLPAVTPQEKRTAPVNRGLVDLAPKTSR